MCEKEYNNHWGDIYEEEVAHAALSMISLYRLCCFIDDFPL